ncbi:pilus assembly protein PilP [Enterovibrio sp. Hal110]
MKSVSLLMMVLVLSGCGDDNGHDDLERFISKTYASAEVTATPLPPKPSFSPLAFAPPVKTDPFVLPMAMEEEALAKGDCWQPERLPKNDPLERFELSSLTFKGVIGALRQLLGVGVIAGQQYSPCWHWPHAWQQSRTC